MAKKIAIGLDIGATALRAAEVASDARGKNVELQRYAEIPLPLNAVRDGEVIDAATVVQGLKALWAKGGFTSKDVIVGVGNQRVAVRPALHAPNAHGAATGGSSLPGAGFAPHAG